MATSEGGLRWATSVVAEGCIVNRAPAGIVARQEGESHDGCHQADPLCGI
jgi:hypothetical protein